ncbi:DDE Tnp4 domain-containing protein [Citrus sinensis]|uniref:DDE Tnp4 domain-containing protein n=1 Tax=Citrus sinensis TaxID=2711 RepID=A0ACB8J637_CITSI|nr:DDE Tnp4 domain-containing protein [Citrus sinensis]
MNYVEEDATSGSGDDGNILDGHNKRQPVTPSSSGRRKRNRKAAGDAIVEAMLEIAAASKMRAAAITKNEERFSISKCIKVLDDMQDLSGSMDDYDLELDQMELVAAAAGFYYYNSIVKQPQRGISPSGSGFMTQVLEGHDDICRQMFRMDKHVFHKLSDTLRQRGMLRDTSGVIIEEQLAIFLNIVGHNERNRVIQERFQHSGETISRHFNNVLKAIKSLSREFLQPPPQTTPPEILCSHRFYPYFKDCIGVIDGMHIPAHVPAKEQSQFRNKKGLLSQNVLAACTFDLQFIFIYPGWEGSVADSRVLRAVLDDPDQNFPHIPEGSSKIEMLQKHATYCTYILGFSSLILMIKSSMFQEIITWLIWITQTQKDLLLHT